MSISNKTKENLLLAILFLVLALLLTMAVLYFADMRLAVKNKTQELNTHHITYQHSDVNLFITKG